MSLSALNWKRLATVTVTTSTAAGVLDHLWSVLASTNTVYYDGSARTAGSGSAGTWTRYQNAGTTEALYCTPAANTLNHRMIIAGVNAVRTPLMGSPDTYSSNILMASVCKNSGAFASWDHATQPFTSGNPMGYWKWWNVGGTAASKLYVLESQDGVAVFLEDTGGSIYGFIAGALWDPISTDTSLDGESDNKLYGMVTSGSTTAIGATATFHSTATVSSTTAFMTHNTTNGLSHVGCMTPGASSTILSLYKMLGLVAATTTVPKTKSGKFVTIPMIYGDRADSKYAGRLREIVYGPDGMIGQVYQESGVDIAYLAGGSSSATQDMDWFLA